MFPIHRLRRSKVVVALILIVLLVIFIVYRNNRASVEGRIKQRLEIENVIEKHQKFDQACKQPDLPVNAPEMMRFVKPSHPIDCQEAGPDWVQCKNSDCNVTEEAKRRYGPDIRCSFTDILRITDNDLIMSNKAMESSIGYHLVASDVVRVNCVAKHATWRSTLTGIRQMTLPSPVTNWRRGFFPNTAEANTMIHSQSVLILCVDSLSRNTFIRKLPKTYRYLTETLKGFVLKGYNIVGDGTPQALIPLLTGKTELELPETRKRILTASFVDVYPFIWQEFKKAGYVTGFFEDGPEVGTFTYRLKGFQNPPTDHYMRPYYLASSSEKNLWPHLCTGSVPRHMIMYNQVKNFFSTYQSKLRFLLAFHGELSHDDYNLIGAADEDLKNLFQDLQDSKLLENTILIVMADHGHRFTKIRNTLQGKQEERLPFFSFVFPENFSRNFPTAYENFQSNIDRLVTPFDIHATLKDVLNYNPKRPDSITKSRSISLFNKIPIRRTCADAFIEPHWCACLTWNSVATTADIGLTNNLGATLVQTINNATAIYEQMCQKIETVHIESIQEMAPNQELLKFSHNADVDGFVGEFSDQTAVDQQLYQIKATVQPSNAIYEATITYHKAKNLFRLQLADISRIDMYGTQAACVVDNLPDLRKFCLCKT